jgi:hypothetical protein
MTAKLIPPASRLNDVSLVMAGFGIGLSLGLLVLVGVVLAESNEPSEGYSCNIGKPHIVGDYIVHIEGYFNERRCAIADCAAYNQIMNETRCVV